MLEKLRKDSHYHTHLVDLLATYEQNEQYHLVFPWAQSDLFDFWRHNPSPDKSTDRAYWLIKQCHGLVEALHRIHRYKTQSGSLLLDIVTKASRAQKCAQTQETDDPRPERSFFGRHGDLKPENILWFPDRESKYGILKISDFGSTRFSTEETKYGRVPNSLTYQSPEYKLDGRFGIACDIWALGCVYLLFTTWYFGGFKAIQSFGKERLKADKSWADIPCDTFFVIDEDKVPHKAAVKPAIITVSLKFCFIMHIAANALSRKLLSYKISYCIPISEKQKHCSPHCSI